ncbi:MAG: hypothetical protein OXT64_03445 [Gammaproteobacteria bacterium]|nr:hypothetical protein [Gammaproteobacteria bacterium]
MQRPIEKPPGTPVEILDTPALIVDLNTLDASFSAVPGPARAEVWVHGTPAIARRQLAHPMVFGIAVRSVGEAEVFAAAGFDDIRILRPLVTEVSKRRAEALPGSIHVAGSAMGQGDRLPLWGVDALDGAVTVSARVTSVPERGRAIHDCGQKAIGRDHGDPRIIGGDRLKSSGGSAEHGTVLSPPGEPPFAIGDWLQLVPADVPTAFALHDFVFGVRDGRLEAVWPISARGVF